jgi:NAD(P)-dependent dehydrogenase (short-subunit alcohol dehydrogenase family)
MVSSPPGTALLPQRDEPCHLPDRQTIHEVIMLSFPIRMATIVATAIVSAAPLNVAAQAPPAAERAVLVTGASSGIGRKITETLASHGWFVYAGARKPDDMASLNAIPNVQAVKLDVTDAADIAAAVETVRQEGRGLYGVVNNAGIAVLAPLIDVEEEEMQSIFDVNVFGPYRITKAFAPLLIESKGRVVTISSISGILSGPFFGPYSMTKHAMEAFGDALAAEMARFEVKSSLIEPGNYKSEIGRNTTAQAEAAFERMKGTPFEEQARTMVAAMGNYDNYPEPDDVAAAALHALSDSAPKMRYMVVATERQAEVTIRKAIEELVQLNQTHNFSYDRDALIRMLDETLARTK